MDRFHLLSVFLAVADCGSLAGAARRLGMSPPAVTRAVNELEKHLGLRLLSRTTRAVRVTEAGARYLEDARRIMAALQDADDSASGQHGAPRGRLTVTAPALFGAMHVTPIVVDYLGRYAQTSVSCLFLDRVVNLVDEGVEVAVRIGELPDSSLRAVRVGQVRRVICASPDYLARHGAPQRVEDLSAHQVVAAAQLSPSLEWRVREGQAVRSVKVQPRMLTTSNESAREAAIRGLGLTRLLSYQVAQALAEGTLVAVLPQAGQDTLPVHVVHHEGRHPPPRVRAFLDLAIAALRANAALH